MGVSTTTNKSIYVGNGVTTAFAAPFLFYDNTHLQVSLVDTTLGTTTLQTLGTHYSVSGAGVVTGGTVTFVTPPATGFNVLVKRVVPTTQLVDLKEGDKFPPETVEQALDFGVMIDQQLAEVDTRCIKLPEGITITDLLLPDITLPQNRGKAIIINPAGDGFDVIAVQTTDFANPLTTKGDIPVHTGAAVTRKPVGTNDQILVADSTNATGVVWKDAASVPAVAAIASVQNPIINGSFDVWQRGTAFVSPSSGTYLADRWKREGTSAGAYTVNQLTSANLPTVAQASVFFNFGLEIDVTTADASVAAGDLEALVQRVEGYLWRPFAQRACTLSFWVKSTKTGTHCVALRNSGDDRSYVATYTVLASDTWEYKTIAVSASPSAGTWNYTTGTGLTISFTLMCGSTAQTTAGTWQTGNFSGTSAQVNCLDSTANFFRITGVRLDAGSVAMPYSTPDWSTELLRCQRYYQKSFNYATAPATNAGVPGSYSFPSPVGASTASTSPLGVLQTRMRSAPTTTLYNPSAANSQVRNLSLSTDCSGSSIGASETGQSASFTTPASTVAGTHSLAYHWTAEAEL